MRFIIKAVVWAAYWVITGPVAAIIRTLEKIWDAVRKS